MSLKKARELLTELRSMANKAGPAFFERVKKAAELLLNKEWLSTAEFNGNYDLACQFVESECFPEAKDTTMDEMLTLYREFPEEKQWADEKYNLRRLWGKMLQRKRQEREAVADEKRKQEAIKSDGPPRATMADVQHRDEQIKELNYTIKKEREVAESLLEKCQRLEKENAELEKQNSYLSGRVAELEQMVDKQMDRQSKRMSVAV